MTRFYFAYGSNMDPEQMLTRCPRARSVGRGRIRHRRFVINSRGVATISPERDAKTWGGVWAISAAEEAALDRIVRGAFAFRLPDTYIARIMEPFIRDEELPLAC